MLAPPQILFTPLSMGLVQLIQVIQAICILSLIIEMRLISLRNSWIEAQHLLNGFIFSLPTPLATYHLIPVIIILLSLTKQIKPVPYLGLYVLRNSGPTTPLAETLLLQLGTLSLMDPPSSFFPRSLRTLNMLSTFGICITL